MKTVNEIAFGTRLFLPTETEAKKGTKVKPERPKEYQATMIEAFGEAAKHTDDDLYVRCRDNVNTCKMYGMGDTAILELFGAVGIFLTQFSEREIKDAIIDRYDREMFVPLFVQKPRL